jgi:hypothetical protein
MENIMRMLLKAVMDTETANQDSQAGTIVENTARLLDALKPEAAYFVVEDGQRSCLVIFDMEDPSQIPSICEPIFLGAKGKVTLTPCMTLEDLTKGFAQFRDSQAG